MSTTKTFNNEKLFNKTKDTINGIKKHRIYEFAKKEEAIGKNSFTNSAINEIKEIVKTYGEEVKQQTQTIQKRFDNHFNMILEPNTKALIDKFNIPLDNWQQQFVKNDLDKIQSNLKDPEFKKKLQKVKALKNSLELKKSYKLYQSALTEEFVAEFSEMLGKISMPDIVQIMPFLRKVTSFIDEIKEQGLTTTNI
ncbi:hypothetical protein NBT05_07590 [Aquimarina sp. ERC-38]|uniref:hypothetical protein n=1 Tax=Aquimarina sp. ERC-38 TaxID=2949996 RepID=UPI00224577EA|nr:hypothetical protein [Aquimarina sp. ERC-38]UZO82328.1 hypothetical protein NBT05_07590 [Aquimarina sp. ERC-38]